MCGIAGVIIDANFQGEPLKLNDCVRKMCDFMNSRGPDASGHWISEDGLVAFGHRRLSIIDLDVSANQPIYSDDNRYLIIFNGEIYNFEELRTSLLSDGYVFHTHSDTEVILALYIHDGEKMLSKLRGMFAIAIWDKVLKTLFLARDPYGIKPLYIARSEYGWLFASQVKALLASGLVSRDPDFQGQASFWLLGSVSEPNTWFKDISALPAGSWAKIAHNCEYSGPQKYWDIGDSWRDSRKLGSEEDIKEHVRCALIDSVQHHMVSDVPIAVFLSSGIDSGVLAALMVECGATNLLGITISYDEFEGSTMDEAPVAAEIAKHYGIRHHVRRVTKEEFYNDLPLIMDAMDQPTIDGINTWFASKAVAEQGLKVVVSGVGGDELFLGYSSFRQLPVLVKLMKITRKFPGGLPIANFVARIQAFITGNPRWENAPSWLQKITSSWWLRRSVFTPKELSYLMGGESAKNVLENFSVDGWLNKMVGSLSSKPELELAQIESMIYLRNQLLRDSDWASMAHSVELRTPLVDAYLLNQIKYFLPLFVKYPNKTLLAKSPVKPLPKKIIERRKTGFGIPVEQWLIEGNFTSAKGSRCIARYIAEAYESNTL